MGQKTVSQLIQGVSFNVNGTTTVPDEGSAEWSLFLEALNQSQTDVEGVDYEWKSLRYTHRTTVTTSGTSVSLPSNFVKPMGFATVGGVQYPEVGDYETGKFLTTDKYVVYNHAERYLTINPASATTTTVNVPYYSRASALASSSQTSFVPNDNYLIKKASAYVLLTRQDPKYQEYLQQADEALAQMIGKEVNDFVQRDTSVKNHLTDVHKFRLGVD